MTGLSPVGFFQRQTCFFQLIQVVISQREIAGAFVTPLVLLDLLFVLLHGLGDLGQDAQRRFISVHLCRVHFINISLVRIVEFPFRRGCAQPDLISDFSQFELQAVILPTDFCVLK